MKKVLIIEELELAEVIINKISRSSAYVISELKQAGRTLDLDETIEERAEEHGSLLFNLDPTEKKYAISDYRAGATDQQAIEQSKRDDFAEGFVRDSINEVINGMYEWIKNETEVYEKGTRNIVDNVELNTKEGAKSIGDYIYPKIKEKGIIFYKDSLNK